jgi:rRNA-processing protein FCF1
MDKYVLDTSAVNRIVDTPGAYQAVRSAVDRGGLVLLYPHVTLDELQRTPDPNRRKCLTEVLKKLGRQVPTGALVLDESRVGQACLTDNQGARAFERLRSKNGVVKMEYTRDALITSAAKREGCGVIATDQGLEDRAHDEGITVLKTEDFFAQLGL